MVFMIFLSSACTIMGVRKEETPLYQVEKSDKQFEIRHYSEFIVAKTIVNEEFKPSRYTAFKILANYIFGDNQEKQKIAMTAPVATGNHQGIPLNENAKVLAGKSWEVTFMMPKSYTLESLPKPNDDRIVFEKVSKESFAVIRFSGSTSNENFEENYLKLKAWMDKNNLKAGNKFWYWLYDPPWTIPFRKRNEIAISLKDSDSNN